VSLVLIIIHDGAEDRGEMDALEVMDLSLFLNFNGMWWFLVQDSMGTFPGRCATMS
jgi:hypothetical protein